MQFLRKSAVAAAASLLVILLFGFGLSWSLQQVFGSSKDIKHTLRSSGIYQSVVAEVLDSAQKDRPTGNNSNDVPVGQPEVRKIIENSFPPSFLQSQTEQVLDAGYAWANNKTQSLQFSIDLTGPKQQLADGLQQYAAARLATLPVCTASTMPSGDVDAFNATCIPPGFDKNAAAAKIKDNILNGDFLKNATITPSSIKDNDGKTLDQQLQSAPQAYRRAKQGVYAGGVLALLLVAAIIALSSPWRSGVRKVSVITIVVGGVSALLGWAATVAVQRVADKVANSRTDNQQLQHQLTSIVQSLIDDVCKWWIGYGVVLVGMGVATLLVLHFTKPRTTPRSAEPETAVEKSAPEEPAPKPNTEIQAPPTRPTSVKKPRPPHLVS
jgi:hypothetical protein